MADVAGFAVGEMKPESTKARLSLELPDEATAMRLAQEIANACGGIVTVVDAIGHDIGRASPQHGVARSGSATIASLRKLADAAVRRPGSGEEDGQ